MNLKMILQRFLIPAPLVTLYYYFKYGAIVSMKAEVEYCSTLKMGRGTRIASFCKVKATHGPLELGDNVHLGVGCFLSSHEGGLYIGNDVLLSPHVSIIASNYRYDQIDVPLRLQGHTSQGIRIGNNVWVGTGSVILDNTQIGDGVIISPNSVVSAMIPDNAIVQGNPAKVIFIRR
mgnify:CR=1 FL=1